MKKVLFTAIVFVFALVLQAQPPAGDAKPGEWYGEKTSPDGAVSIAELPAKLEKNPSVDVKIKAKVLEVCPKKRMLAKIAGQ